MADPLFNNREKNAKPCSGILNLEKLLELGLPSNFFNKPKRLLCPICRTSWSSKGIAGHLAADHLPNQCLQVAKCNNPHCTKKRDIFSVNYLTDHFMEEKCEHDLIYPKKKCRHRVNCQVALDTLMDIAIYFGFVDSKGQSLDPAHKERIAAFDANSRKVHAKDFFIRDLHIDKNDRKEACFVTADRDDRERNGEFVASSGGDYQEYQRSPAYGRSPGASPGPGFGGSSPAGGRSPSGSRSPSGYESPLGGRSPGGGAGYEEPDRRRRRIFNTRKSDATDLRAGEHSPSISNNGSSRSAKRPTGTEEARLRIKAEPIESSSSTSSTTYPHQRNLSPPAKRAAPLPSSTSNRPATSSIPLPPMRSQFGERGSNDASLNLHAFPKQLGMVPNGGYSAYPSMGSTQQASHNAPMLQSQQFSQYSNGYHVPSSGTVGNRSSDSSNYHSSGANGHYSRRQDEQRSMPADRHLHNRHTDANPRNFNSSRPPPRPQLERLLPEKGGDKREARDERRHEKRRYNN